MVSKAVLKMALALACCSAAHPAKADETDVKTMVGIVGELWNDEVQLKAFYARWLSGLKGAPTFEEVRDRDGWVVVLDIAAPAWSPHLGARTTSVGPVQKGDVVEVRFARNFKASAYSEMSEVVKVLCRRADPGYSSCREKTSFGAFDSNGAPASWRRPRADAGSK